MGKGIKRRMGSVKCFWESSAVVIVEVQKSTQFPVAMVNPGLGRIKQAFIMVASKFLKEFVFVNKYIKRGECCQCPTGYKDPLLRP